MRVVPEKDDSVLGDAQVDLDGVGAALVQGRSVEFQRLNDSFLLDDLNSANVRCLI